MFGLSSSGLFNNDFGFLADIVRIKTTKRVVICNNKPIEPVRRNAKIGGIMKIGTRQPGDVLLRLEKVLVQSGASKFPRHTFDFTDHGASINEVTITAGVSRIFVQDPLQCMIQQYI